MTPSEVVTVADALAAELAAWGVRLVFGMPGESSLPLVDAVRKRDDLRYIVVRHEEAAAMAASAYHKLTGGVAACLTIAGPGATNLATGLYDAKEDRAAVLALCGQVQTQYTGPGGFQEIDQDAFFRPVTVFNNTVADPSTAIELLTRALRYAVINRGVAQLSVPGDVQRDMVRPAHCRRESCLPGGVIAPADDAIERAAGVIDGAKQPVIVAGWGAMKAAASVLALAGKLAAPIVTTFRAKGIFPDENEWLVGIHGPLGPPQARKVVDEADLLIACGVGFSQYTGLPADKPTVQIEVDPLQIGKHPFAAALWGHCEVILPALAGRVRERRDDAVLPRIAAMKQEWNATLEREANPNATPLRPPFIMQALSETVPADAVITVDVGENGWWFGRNFVMKRQRFAMSGYLGTMGFALPGAIAAKLAYPEKTVVCITGDGGFAMGMGDFTTAVKYDLPMAVVILNNHELAMITEEQREAHYPPYATDLTNPNFAAYGELCGGAGKKVSRPGDLRAVLAEAMRADVPFIVDIETDPRRFV
ncbi:thiamine pyrophosphate-binding protein [Methanoculleus sp. FWC-SCC1]|uniref:Thiamine pyrophosphate-binding protein n=1 Tax=Methanoculleus frigidifontis TaxID=2584085 RepID=A0ABT8MC75_9EURY|nr:thiamine pyrophosphate-dependent enzyme [Methanoculleus sp. FWC-SCC1]MDN7025548.1 thiamine pyrophosphate-binding protein [Methanoculleus sp. FWC-SCC1]